jgi:sugar lactone lactonase YvrE
MPKVQSSSRVNPLDMAHWLTLFREFALTGIDVLDGQLFFISKEIKSMFILDLDGTTYLKTSTIHGLFDGQPDQVQRIVGSRSGLLYFTEDGGEYAGVHARNVQGQFFTILESHEYTDETTGLAFSPDGKFMYIAYQDNGLLFQVWREDGLSFDAQSLNVKFHAK